MLGEILAEIALEAAGSIISEVGPAAINAGVAAATVGINYAKDKINDVTKVKRVKKTLGVEEDIYLEDAIRYYNLLDNINSGSFESAKASLLKV